MTTYSKAKYRYIGTVVGDLHDGRILVPGEVYALTAAEVDDPHNQQLIESGKLIEAVESKEGDK